MGRELARLYEQKKAYVLDACLDDVVYYTATTSLCLNARRYQSYSHGIHGIVGIFPPQ